MTDKRECVQDDREGTSHPPSADHDCKPAELRNSRKSETLLRVKINCPTTQQADIKTPFVVYYVDEVDYCLRATLISR